MVSLGFAAVSDENFEKCVKNPGKVGHRALKCFFPPAR